VVSVSPLGGVVAHLQTTATPGEREYIVNGTPTSSSTERIVGRSDDAADYISVSHIHRHLLVSQ